MSSPAMIRRRSKFGAYQQAKHERSLRKALKSMPWYGGLGYQTLIHNGRKPTNER